MSSHKKRKIIYIADDDRGIVEALSFMLEDAGYHVESAYDDSVMDLIEKKQPDLLILDIWMSGSNGGDICKKLKKNAFTMNIPIIMISANPDTRVISKKCGANDYISKPFNIDGLLEKIVDNLTQTPVPMAG